MPPSLREPDWPLALDQTSPGEPAVQLGSLTIAALPDTQYYVSCRSQHLENQAQWLVRAAERQHLQAVVTLGDLTEHNEPAEWQFFVDRLTPVGRALPLIYTAGNHDYGERGSANRRQTLFDTFVTGAGELANSALAGTFEQGQLENAYYRFRVTRSPTGLTSRPLGPGRSVATANEFTLGILSLEWSPRAVVVKWAKELLRRFPEDRRVLVVHAYLYHDDTRYDFAKRGESQRWNPLSYGTETRPGEAGTGHDGEMLWRELVFPERGFFLTLSGHVLGDGSGYLLSRNAEGKPVHQLLANYQMLNEGGLGYLRLLELPPTLDRLLVKTYSPSLDLTSHAPDQEFNVELEWTANAVRPSP